MIRFLLLMSIWLIIGGSFIYALQDRYYPITISSIWNTDCVTMESE